MSQDSGDDVPFSKLLEKQQGKEPQQQQQQQGTEQVPAPQSQPSQPAQAGQTPPPQQQQPDESKKEGQTGRVTRARSQRNNAQPEQAEPGSAAASAKQRRRESKRLGDGSSVQATEETDEGGEQGEGTEDAEEAGPSNRDNNREREGAAMRGAKRTRAGGARGGGAAQASGAAAGRAAKRQAAAGGGDGSTPEPAAAGTAQQDSSTAAEEGAGAGAAGGSLKRLRPARAAAAAASAPKDEQQQQQQQQPQAATPRVVGSGTAGLAAALKAKPAAGGKGGEGGSQGPSAQQPFGQTNASAAAGAQDKRGSPGELTLSDKEALLQQLMKEFDAAHSQAEKKSKDLQAVLDSLFQEPVSEVSRNRELINSVRAVSKWKDDDAVRHLKFSSTQLFQIWKKLNKEDKRSESAAEHRHLYQPSQETAGADAAAASKPQKALSKPENDQNQSRPSTSSAGQPTSSTTAAMPNGCAVPRNTVVLSGFSSTGDTTRDAAVSLLTACLEEPASACLPVEVALETEEQLFNRYAEPSSTTAGTSSTEPRARTPGNNYKAHLHALWRLLSDSMPASGKAEGAGPSSSGAQGGHAGPAPEANGDGGGAAAAESSIGESSRRALLAGLFTSKELLDTAFS